METKNFLQYSVLIFFSCPKFIYAKFTKTINPSVYNFERHDKAGDNKMVVKDSLGQG
jgi:hypothetical protein